MPLLTLKWTLNLFWGLYTGLRRWICALYLLSNCRLDPYLLYAKRLWCTDVSPCSESIVGPASDVHVVKRVSLVLNLVKSVVGPDHDVPMSNNFDCRNMKCIRRTSRLWRPYNGRTSSRWFVPAVEPQPSRFWSCFVCGPLCARAFDPYIMLAVACAVLL